MCKEGVSSEYSARVQIPSVLEEGQLTNYGAGKKVKWITRKNGLVKLNG
jgi:hypothetical protein